MNVQLKKDRCGGCHYHSLEVFDSQTPIAQPLLNKLPFLLRRSYFPFAGFPLLIEAGTGAGKTTAILEAVIPFALEQRLTVCFVSSRAAISTQFKLALGKTLGLTGDLANYSPQGLRSLSRIGSVHVLTYHALWRAVYQGEAWLRDIGVFVMDEVHALALDAPFVPFTGALLRALPLIFRHAARIYLTATPEPILHSLLCAEGDDRLTIWRWPTDYSAYKIHFYTGPQDVIQRVNSLPEGERVLVFVRSIAEAQELKAQTRRSCRIVSSATKEREPDVWSALLESKQLDCQVLFATTTLDAGVSLTDPALKHIFCVGVNAAAAIQQAGRKRLRSGERISIYLWSPPRQSLSRLLQKNYEILAAMHYAKAAPYQFFHRYILGDDLPEIRKMCATASGPSPQINDLAREFFLQERDTLQALISQESEHPLDDFWLGVFNVADDLEEDRWLDRRFDETAKQALLSWLTQQIGVELKDAEAKQKFGCDFKALYQAGYGHRKNDRSDRTWGIAVIRKILAELALGISIISVNGTWRLEKS